MHSIDSGIEYLLPNIRIPAFLLSESQEILFCNREFEYLADKPADQLIGTYPLQCLSIIDIADFEKRIADCIETGETCECKGSLDTVPVVIRFFSTEKGILVTLDGEFRHDTEFNGRSPFRNLSDSSSDLVFRFDRNHEFLYANQAFASLLGLTEQEIVGKTLRNLQFDETLCDLLEMSMDLTLETSEPQEHTFEVEIKNRRMLLEWRVAPEVSEDGSIHSVLGVSRDITRITELEDQLSRKSRLSAIGGIAGILAHDINNILTPVLGNAEAALLNLPRSHPRWTQINDIRKAVERARGLTGLLHILSHDGSLEADPVDLSEVVKNHIGNIGRIMGEYIELELILDEFPCIACIDIHQLGIALTNLIEHASDSMAGSGTIVIKTGCVFLDEDDLREIALNRPGNYSMISISNSGVGMTEDELEQLFNPFNCLEDWGIGTGLGLYVANRIIVQHQGCLCASSEPGQGSTMRIYLPEAAETPSEIGYESARLTELIGSETVIVVDDDQMVRDLSCDILSVHGYTVLSAEDSDQCEAILEQYEDPVHLLLTDIAMPGRSGIELHEALAINYPYLRVLYMSGYDSSVFKRYESNLPNPHLIRKPFGVIDLLRMVRKVLDD